MVKKLVSLLLLLFCFSAVSMAADKKFTLVIDPGHGGKDAGAIGVSSKEKNINLSVALAFGRYVEQYCPSVRVIYTRKTDVFVELQERANIANRNKADLFISVHTNAVAGSKSVRGFETYTLGMHRAGDNLDVAKRENSVISMESDYESRYQGFDPNSAESYIMFEYMQDKNMENSVNLAKFIQSSVCIAASRQNKGVHQAGFLVLRETSMPSCLVELGFISTPDEERQLNDPITQDQFARGLYQAFVQYLNKYSNGVKASALAPVQESSAKKVTSDEPVIDTKVREVPKAEEKKPAKAEEKKSVKVEEKKPAKQESKAPETRNQKPETRNQTPEGSRGSKSVSSGSSATSSSSAPVFKVQILTGNRQMKSNDSQFKGLEGVDSFKEGGIYKYTYGASTNYNEIATLRKSILDKFPQAFVIAFKDGEKMNVSEAIKEWKNNKK